MYSTEILTGGSVHEYDSSDKQQIELKSPIAKHKSCYEQDEQSLEQDSAIESLYQSIPALRTHFDIISKIGEGTFSSVYVATLRKGKEVGEFALKHIIPTCHPSRIANELRCLQTIGGKDNVIGCEVCVKSAEHVVLAMKYLQHDRFQDYLLCLTLHEVQQYLFALVTALRRVHSFGIIHRDVKPSNFLYNRTHKKYALVDFGLAQQVPPEMLNVENPLVLCSPPQSYSRSNLANSPKHQSGKENLEKTAFNNESPSVVLGESRKVMASLENCSNTPSLRARKSPLRRSPRSVKYLSRKRAYKCRSTHKQDSSRRKCDCLGKPRSCHHCTNLPGQQAPRAGTPGFRPPEVLIKHPQQTTAIDMWAVGVILLSFLSGRYPFFKASSDLEAYRQIMTVFGTDACVAGCKSVGKTMVCKPHLAGHDLQQLCISLRQGALAPPRGRHRSGKVEGQRVTEANWVTAPQSAYDFLKLLLDLDPQTRISAEQALTHPFFTETFV